MHHPTKLNDYIGIFPAEFERFYELFEPALREAGGMRGHRYRRCKFSPRVRLYVLLEYLRSNDTVRMQEMHHSWAKSSCSLNLYHCARVLCDVLRNALGDLFPGPEEQDALVQLGPGLLRELGVFLFVDGTTAISANTANPASAALDYNGFNGFGLNIQIATDILGRCRYYYIGLPGAAHDSNLYHMTDMYLQQNGVEWGPDKSVATDSGYAGHSNNTHDAQGIVKPFTAAQIAALPVHLRHIAVESSSTIRHLPAQYLLEA